MELHLGIVAERVRREIEVREQQGQAVDGSMDRWQEVKDDRQALLALERDLRALPLHGDWPYVETSALEEIHRTRPAVPAALPSFYLAEEEIYAKIHGAWLGRTAGCILGKPLEMHLSIQQIQDYLEGARALPLQNYIPPQSHDSLVLRRDCVPSMRGYVRYAQEDDDLNYMCLAVKLLEEKGLDFSTLDVGMNWIGAIPFLWTWGPEHVVYLNLAAAVGEHKPEHVDLEEVTAYLNPGTEWIGAQIRTDVYGYVCPGRPELAAELAWRDAYLTHRSSGIYGAMWIAAMNAAAFTLLDMEQIIYAGLSQVPEQSRFTEGILQTIEWCKTDGDWRVTGQRIVDHFDKYGFVGTITNACCVAAALLYGWEDGRGSAAERYERTITIAVQLGYDTDCNGASAGSIAGMVLGASALPEKWIAPLNDTMRTSVVGFGQMSISDMARRTYELSRIVRASC